MERILSDNSVSITELKRNPRAIIQAAGDDVVAVLVHNRPSAYLVPASAYHEHAQVRARERRGAPCSLHHAKTAHPGDAS